MKRLALAVPALSSLTLCTCLAVAEAQTYLSEPFNDVVPPQEGVPTEYVTASAVLGGLNLTTSFLNLTPHTTGESPTWSRYAGVLGGLASMGLGGALLLQNKYEDDTGLGISNLLVGTVSTIAGISSIVHAKKSSDTASALHSDLSHITFAPAFHGGMAPGVGVRMRF